MNVPGITSSAPLFDKLYSPGNGSTQQQLAHFSESAYPQGDENSLMTTLVYRGESIHKMGRMLLCMLRMMGYTVWLPEFSYNQSRPVNINESIKKEILSKDIRVYDITGRLISEFRKPVLTDSELHNEINKYTSLDGIYIILIRSEREISIKKVFFIGDNH